MALTGFLVANKCAPDSLEAENALASQFPQYLGSTPPVMCSVFNTWYTPATKAYTLVITCHDLTGATQYQYSHDVILQPCDPAISTAPFFDGMTMGWGVVSAMAAAAAIIFIKKAFYR